MLHRLRNLFVPLLIFTISLAIYVLLAGRLTFNFPLEPANYFSYLTDAFFHGRLDIVNPNWDHDLSKFNGRLYLYWGPTPILFIFPFILIFGLNISDVLYTAIIGAFVPLVLYLILQKLNRLSITNLSLIKKFLLTIFLGFGTVYFSIVVRGGVWFTSQVVTTLFILLAINWMLDFLLHQKFLYLLLSALFLGFASWGRNTFVFYLPFLLSLILIHNHRSFSKKFFYQAAYFLIILVSIFALSLIYNYLRFDSFLETGYSYQEAAARYLQEKNQNGYLSLAYLPHNFYYNFQNFPGLKDQFPFFEFDGEGNSFILLSPLFLLSLLIIRLKYWHNLALKIFNSSIIFCALLIILFQLLFWGTGWFQFSARYMLDVIPLLLILLAQTLEDTPVILVSLLTLISIIINSLGAMWLSNIKL